FDGKWFPDGTRRLIVLHDEMVQPPAPVSYFHAVKVSASQRVPLREFIREVFAEPPRRGVAPVWPELMTDDFATFREQLEQPIINAVSGPQDFQVFAREIQIQVARAALRAAKDNEVPAEAIVKGDADSLALFSLRPNPAGYPWAGFYQGMDR